HTRFSRDWSSDVCSSDLVILAHVVVGPSCANIHDVSSLRVNAAAAIWVSCVRVRHMFGVMGWKPAMHTLSVKLQPWGHHGRAERSEERRVGKERNSA